MLRKDDIGDHQPSIAEAVAQEDSKCEEGFKCFMPCHDVAVRPVVSCSTDLLETCDMIPSGQQPEPAHFRER